MIDLTILEETTDWGKHEVRNHAYVLTKSFPPKLVGYFKDKDPDSWKEFTTPLPFDKRNRTFKIHQSIKTLKPALEL